MSDHETTLRELAAGLLARGRIDVEEPSSASQRADIIRKSERNADACLAGADALRRGTCGTCKWLKYPGPYRAACGNPDSPFKGAVFNSYEAPNHDGCIKGYAPTETTR